MSSMADDHYIDVENDRQDIIRDWLLSMGSMENLNSRFQSEIGLHEVLDRSCMISQNWYEFVAEHPCVALDKETFALAHAANELMNELYARIGNQIAVGQRDVLKDSQ